MCLFGFVWVSSCDLVANCLKLGRSFLLESLAGRIILPSCNRCSCPPSKKKGRVMPKEKANSDGGSLSALSFLSSQREPSSRGPALVVLCPLCSTVKKKKKGSKKRYKAGRGLRSHFEMKHKGRVSTSDAANIDGALSFGLGNLSSAIASWMKGYVSKVLESGSAPNSSSSSSVSVDSMLGSWASVFDSCSNEQLLKAIESYCAREEGVVGQRDEDPLVNAIKEGCSVAQFEEMLVKSAAASTLKRKRDKNPSASILDVLRRKDQTQSTPLEWCGGRGRMQLIDYILSIYKNSQKVPTPRAASSNGRSREGRTFLHYACQYGHLSVVKCVLEDLSAKGEDSLYFNELHSRSTSFVDTSSNDGTTLLHVAVYGGYLPVCKYLVSQSASVNSLNDWGCGVAHFLAISKVVNDDNNEEVVAWLNDVTPEAFNVLQRGGHSVLHKCAIKRRHNTARMIKAAKGDAWWSEMATLTDAEGKTAKELVGGPEWDNL